MTLSGRETGHPRCRWCGRAFAAGSGPGRPRLYCRRSCRQRDYEARRRATELGLGDEELVVTREQLHELQDKLFLLAGAVGDVEQDLADPAGPGAEQLLDALLEAARQAVA